MVLVELKLNPNKFVPAVYAAANELSPPVNLGVCGAIPSSPPWKGTVNLSWFAVGPLCAVVSNDALRAPVHNPESECPV